MSYQSLQSKGAVMEPPVSTWKMGRPKHMLVRWRWHSPSAQQWNAAVVITCNGGTLNLIVFPVGAGQPLAMEGAKHIDDPSLAKMTTPNPGGVWDYSELESEISSRLDKLERMLGNETIQMMAARLKVLDGFEAAMASLEVKVGEKIAEQEKALDDMANKIGDIMDRCSLLEAEVG